MTKQVQWQGSDRESQDLYTGAPREITVDTTNNNLRLHDGATQGGHAILNEANADGKYQARANELDGLTGFAPTDLGLLVRIGPAEYAFRRLAVNGENLTVENAAGQAGNPTISLKGTISSNHTWTGDHTFEGELLAPGGIQGNLVGNTQGNHTGNVFGNLEGNVVGNLQGDATGNHEGTFTGSVDVSGGQLILADKQIPLQALGDDFLDLIARVMPRGSIVMWSGAIDDIPTGWLLCDGTLGTPDLRDRFVPGAGGIYLEGETGGNAQPTLSGTTDSAGSHSHIITVNGTALTTAQLPAHNHRNGVADDAVGTTRMVYGQVAVANPLPKSIDDGADTATIEGYTSNTGEGSPHTHTAGAGGAGAHTHTVTLDPVSTLPPYLALAYIMKGF